MNKLIFRTLVGTLMFSKVMAAYRDIPKDQLESYKTATIIAGHKSNLPNCTRVGSFQELYIENYIKKADSGRLETGGAQPILIFEQSKLESDQAKAIVTVTSSSDYNTIISIKADEFILGDVNTGDLLIPHIEKGYILRSSIKCNSH